VEDSPKKGSLSSIVVLDEKQRGIDCFINGFVMGWLSTKEWK